MAINTTTTHSNQIQRFYDKVLLEHAEYNLVVNQLAKREELPQHTGAKSIRFFRKAIASAADVVTLTEGVTSATRKDQTYTPVDVDLIQYGEASEWSDILEATALLKVVTDGIATMGDDAALKFDDVTIGTIAHATTGGTKRYSGGVSTFAAFNALTPANGKLIGDNILDATTQLRLNFAPRIGGEYVGIMGPRIARDFMRDTTWVNAKVYSDVKDLYKAEAGTFYGVRFILTNNEWVEDDTEGTRDTTPDADSNYVTVITGKDAYGVVNLSGMSPFSPSVTVLDRPDKTDPYNQKIVATWKAYWGAAVLNSAWVVALRSKALFA